MLVRLFFLLVFLCSTIDVAAQRRKRVSPIGQGTLYGFVGYNRSAYGLSDFSVAANNHNFTMHDVRFSDNPTGAPITSFLVVRVFLIFKLEHNWAIL